MKTRNFFGLSSVITRILTIMVHLLVICKILSYSWVSGGQITDYETAVRMAGVSIIILVISIVIYCVANDILKVKLPRWTQIILLTILIINIPFDVCGVIMQFLGTNFEKYVTSILAIITLIGDCFVAVYYFKKFNQKKAE